jgi:hypothetical protein
MWTWIAAATAAPPPIMDWRNMACATGNFNCKELPVETCSLYPYLFPESVGEIMETFVFCVSKESIYGDFS